MVVVVVPTSDESVCSRFGSRRAGAFSSWRDLFLELESLVVADFEPDSLSHVCPDSEPDGVAKLEMDPLFYKYTAHLAPQAESLGMCEDEMMEKIFTYLDEHPLSITGLDWYRVNFDANGDVKIEPDDDDEPGDDDDDAHVIAQPPVDAAQD